MKAGATLTAFCMAVAFAAAGAILKPERQAETLLPPADHSGPSSINRVHGVRIPASKLAHDATQLIIETEDDFLLQHSARVCYWVDLRDNRQGLTFDPDLLYIMGDNLSVHMVSDVRAVVSARGATLMYLPQYSPDLNPIEQLFPKALLRKAAARTGDSLWKTISDAIEAVTPGKCTDPIRNSSYEPV